jgi:hypothetical protein
MVPFGCWLSIVTPLLRRRADRCIRQAVRDPGFPFACPKCGPNVKCGSVAGIPLCLGDGPAKSRGYQNGQRQRGGTCANHPTSTIHLRFPSSKTRNACILRHLGTICQHGSRPPRISPGLTIAQARGARRAQPLACRSALALAAARRRFRVISTLTTSTAPENAMAK